MEVAYRGAAQDLSRIPDAAAIATAVERALADNGFKVGGKTMAEPVTSVSAVEKAARVNHGHFEVTVVAFAPQLHPISEAVREVAFHDEVAQHLRQDGHTDISNTDPGTLHPVGVKGGIVSGEPEPLKFPSPPPSPFAPAPAAMYWQSNISFDVRVAYQVPGDPLPNEGDVASAVQTALDRGGFKTGDGETIAEPVTSVSAVCKTDLCKTAPGRRLQGVDDQHDDFTVTVVAFAPALQPISKAVREVSFGDEVAKELSNTEGVTVEGDIVMGDLVAKDKSTSPTPGGTGDAGQGLETASLAEANEAAQAVSEDAVPGWGVFLIVLLLLCLLSPVFCYLYAHFMYGTGKESTWFKYRFTHSNPTLPFMYVPREDREALLVSLLEKEKPAANLEQEQAGKV